MAKKKSKPKPAVKAKPKNKPAPAKNKPAAQKPVAAKPAAAAKLTWLDESSQQPTIDRYARRLKPFVLAMADGKIDEAELKAQEDRLVKLMKEVEPALPPALHAKVTQLLYELTAYDMMQVLYQFEQARPRAAFQG